MGRKPKVHHLKAKDLILDSPETVHLSLRLQERLRQRLERAALDHNISLSREIHLRLEDSFQRETNRTIDKVVADLEICWLRFSARFLRLDLEDTLAEKLAACRELPPDIAQAARLWLAHRTQEQRPSSLGASRS
jgi:hypothetical protein